MLKERTEILRRFVMLFDISVIAFSYVFIYFLRVWLYGYQQSFEDYLKFLPILLLSWGYMLYTCGMYRSFRTREPSEIFYIIFKSAFFGLLISSAFFYFFKITNINRDFIAIFFIVTTAALSLEKMTLVSFFRYFRRRGYNFRNILVIGSNRRAENFIEIVTNNPEWGYRIIGIIDRDPQKIGEEVRGIKIIGSFEKAAEILHNNVIDEVVFIVPRSWLENMQGLISMFETEGISISIAADFFNLMLARAKPLELQGFPLLTFVTTSDKYWQLFIKRIMDEVVSFIALIMLWPFFVIAAITIKATSKGPVFFRQIRSGVNGRKFVLYKFRTMIEGAEKKLKDIAAYNEMEGPVFKAKNDPRITPLGRLFRKFSIDELPQLWNVLKGDMSLVGPRPPIPAEVNKYDSWHRRRLSMRPGITCLWQVSGRNKIKKFDEWMKLDLEYIDSWSLKLDFKILLKTIPVVLFGIGAH